MAKLKNLSFDDGYESITVNGDKDRVIRFNPADPEIINRLLNLRNSFQNYQPEQDFELNPDGTPKNDMEKGAAFVSEFSNAMRKAFNDTFNSDVYDTIFKGQSPLCIVGPKGNKKYLFEFIIEGLVSIMEPAVEEYLQINQEKMQKYLGDL